MYKGDPPNGLVVCNALFLVTTVLSMLNLVPERVKPVPAEYVVLVS